MTLRSLLAGLLAVVVAGCGGENIEQKKAYEEALRVIERERLSLKNMTAERERLYGEYLVHDFESRIWSGQFVPHHMLGFDLGNDFGSDKKLLRLFYRKWPLGGLWQLDRLLARSSDLLPWYDRYQGDIHRRRMAERYVRMLNDLRDRIIVQADRVRKSEEYALIVKPEGS